MAVWKSICFKWAANQMSGLTKCIGSVIATEPVFCVGNYGACGVSAGGNKVGVGVKFDGGGPDGGGPGGGELAGGLGLGGGGSGVAVAG